ncbi:hypothetical protein LCGC14_0846560 [marine sediment metagenome]|uniref:Uncharacterized protein n=1 Tax=marine sediment metagenome TaxID=412755 RepID=A0A0F9SIL6_9ZZZZ
MINWIINLIIRIFGKKNRGTKIEFSNDGGYTYKKAITKKLFGRIYIYGKVLKK